MKKRRLQRTAAQEAKKLVEESVILTTMERTAIQAIYTERDRVERMAGEITKNILEARRYPLDTYLDIVDLDKGIVRFRYSPAPGQPTPPPGLKDEELAEKVVEMSGAPVTVDEAVADATAKVAAMADEEYLTPEDYELKCEQEEAGEGCPEPETPDESLEGVPRS